METEKNDNRIVKRGNQNTIPIAIVVAGTMLTLAILYTSTNPTYESIGLTKQKNKIAENVPISAFEEAVLPTKGVVLPISWDDMGIKLVNSGAINKDKFVALYQSKSTYTDEYKKLLLENNSGKLKITKDNAGYLLNLFWALGLANNNTILDSGEMTDRAYGGAKNFASTGGWTMSEGNPMDHYSRHALVTLTPEQQLLVDKVSRGIYRPCCGNSTHFPDCNHGMAMLGFLELMASKGVSEKEMYKNALVLNSYWFPDTYLTIATYMQNKGVEWKDVDPREMLGINYSSGQGFAKISSQVAPSKQKSGGNGCGVEAGQPIDVPKQQSGCGV